MGFKPAALQHRRPRRVARREIILIRQQGFHAAAEHHIRHGRFCLRRDALQQLGCSAGNHLHPNARPPLKFLDNRLINLLLVGGIDHQPHRVIRRVGPREGGQKAEQQRAQPFPFHSFSPFSGYLFILIRS